MPDFGERWRTGRVDGFAVRAFNQSMNSRHVRSKEV
jgi:hypothetical protein